MNYRHLGDEYIWIMIYSNTKSNQTINIKYSGNMEYIGYNCFIECKKIIRYNTLNKLIEIYDKFNKCYKILNFENQKHVKEEINLDLDKNYDFNIKEYLL